MHCGQMLASSGGSIPLVDATPHANGRRLIVGVIGAILVLAGLLFALDETGLLRAAGSVFRPQSLAAQGQSGQPPALPAEGSAQDSRMLSSPGQAGGSSLPIPDSKRFMPDDVRRWLEHLERIERKRGDLSREHLATAITTMTALQLGGSMSEIEALLRGDLEGLDENQTPPTIEKATTDMESMTRAWVSLNDEFLSVPPPEECVPIRNQYDQVLRETGAMILDIVQAVDNASTDREGALQALLSMKGKSEERIGRPAERTDQGVAQICDKYETRKWFSISRDFGGGGLLKSLGM